MLVEINRPGIFRKLRTEELQVKSYSGGYPYRQDGVVKTSSPASPVYSYAMNFKKHNKEFSLFIWTTESDSKKIIDHFEKVKKGVSKEQVHSIVSNPSFGNFNYLEPSLKE